ncbi:MAG: LysM peptidoglycan-binding domain-containing protein [Acidimicrobiales bacterium]
MRKATAWAGAVALGVSVVSIGPAGADVTYRVRPGDTLTSVAARLGVTPARLAAANAIPDPDHVRAGLVLTLSSGSYRVRRGDTLSGIAPMLGISESSLAAANRLPDPDLIMAGSTLVLPRPAAAARAPLASPAAAAPRTTASPSPPPEAATVAVPWRCPVAGSHFVDDFGYVRLDGTPHQGVDVFAPGGTPVVAPVGGMVAEYPNTLGGKAFQLWGRDGNRYYGAHLSAYGHTGWVTAGTVIGYVGNTGDAVGGPTHLHFELHPGGGPAASPYPFLAQACR